jgi:flagellar motor switch protein FliN
MPDPSANSSPPQGSKPSEHLVEEALAEAQASVQALQQEAESAGSALDLPDLDGTSAGGAKGIELLRDVDLHVSIELGRTEMLVEDVLRLGPGSVVELDKLAGDPVDVYVNNRLVARGEVLVLNDNFCIRISEIVQSLDADDMEPLSQQNS